MTHYQRDSRTVLTIRWMARLCAILAVVLIVAMQLVPDPATGTFAAPTIEQAILALFMPGLLVVGFILAWRWETLGGALIIASFPLFVLAIWVLQGTWLPVGVVALMWLLLGLPGVLFWLSAWLRNRPNTLDSADTLTNQHRPAL
jgi:hypothetical protein